MSTQYERKVIILGKTGNGKSSLGNSLLRRQAFHKERSFNAVTTECKLERDDGNMSVVDTPGLFNCDGKRGLVEQALKVQTAIKICPNPHAFLIVLNGSSRLTQEEMLTIDVLRIIFGEQCLKKAIIVLTHIEDDMSDTELRVMLEKSDGLISLINQCGGRFARIDNTDPNPEHIKRIIRLVDTVSRRGRSSFKNEYLHVHKQLLKEALENHDSGSVHEQIRSLAEKIKLAVEDEIEFKKKCLKVAGAGVGVVCVTAGGVAYFTGGATAAAVVHKTSVNVATGLLSVAI